MKNKLGITQLKKNSSTEFQSIQDKNLIIVPNVSGSMLQPRRSCFLTSFCLCTNYHPLGDH